MKSDMILEIFDDVRAYRVVRTPGVGDVDTPEEWGDPVYRVNIRWKPRFSNKQRCQARTSYGTQCARRAEYAGSHCWQHYDMALRPRSYDNLPKRWKFSWRGYLGG